MLKIKKSKTDIYRHDNEVLIAKCSSSACPYSLKQKYMSLTSLNIHSDNVLFKLAFRSKKRASLIKENKSLSYTRAKDCIIKKLKVVAPDLIS